MRAALDSVKGSMGQLWWMDALGGLGFGIRGVDPGRGQSEDNLALSRMLGEQRLAVDGGCHCGGPVAAGDRGTGTRRPGVARIAGLSGPLAVLLSWGVMSAQGKYLHPWYVLYAVPGIVMGLAAASQWFAKWREFGLGALGKVSLPTCCLLFWSSLDLHYAHTSKENVRGLAEAALSEKYAAAWLNENPKPIFAAMLSDANIYDPHLRVIKARRRIWMG